jgi:hypothetical protein
LNCSTLVWVTPQFIAFFFLFPRDRTRLKKFLSYYNHVQNRHPAYATINIFTVFSSCFINQRSMIRFMCPEFWSWKIKNVVKFCSRSYVTIHIWNVKMFHGRAVIMIKFSRGSILVLSSDLVLNYVGVWQEVSQPNIFYVFRGHGNILTPLQIFRFYLS